MSSREKRLAGILGGFAVLAVIVGIGYVLFWLPIQEKNRAALAIQAEIDQKNLERLKILKNRDRLDTALRRSLPNTTYAAQEYEAILTKMLRDAKVPAGSFEVKFRTPDTRTIPELSPKKPAYERTALEITLKKVPYATILDVLHRYYSLNVLHQITKFNLKRSDDPNAKAVSSTSSDKNDLTLTFITEGIILDGAEKRRSLLPVPIAMGAVGGAAGRQALMNTPEPARGIQPIELATVLASTNRDYTMLLARDIFHGPPPPPPKPAPPPVVAQVAPPPPEPPKEDTSRFIRLTALGRSSDGSGLAVIEDLACPTRMEYTITLRRTSDGLTSTVDKETFENGERKAYAPKSAILDISEPSSGTKRKFRVIGVDGEQLILAEIVEPKSGSSKLPSVTIGSPAVRDPAASAVIGALSFLPAFTAPAPTSPTATVSSPASPPSPSSAPPPTSGGETIFAWFTGDPLSRIQPLSKEDAAQAVKRATANEELVERPEPANNTLGELGNALP